MKNFIKNLQFIFKPSYWLMNYPYSPIHDAELNALMDRYEFEKMEIPALESYLYGDKVKIGGQIVRHANFPYAVGLFKYHQDSRPSRLTIQRMGKKIAEDLAKNL